MQASTDTLTVLYVAGEYAPGPSLGQRLATGRRMQFETTTLDAGGPDGRADIDCVVLGAQARDQEYLDATATLQERYPSVPLVAFTGDRGPGLVEDLLDAGASDVVRSTAAHAPSSLVRQRIENVSDGPVVSGETLDRYETTLNTAADAIYQLDADGVITAVNDAAVELLGYDRSELVGTHVSQFLDNADVHRGEQLIQNQLEADEQTFEQVDLEIETADGGHIACEARVAVWTADGSLAGSVGVLRDVTEERARRRDLERQNDLFTKAQEIADVGAWEFDRDGQNTWTEQVYEIFGVSTDTEPSLSTARQCYHPADWKEIQSALVEAITDGRSFDIEARIQGDDEMRWVHLRGDPHVEDGTVTRIRGTVQDITDHKERERALERNREFLRQTQQVADIGGWEVDTETGTSRWTDEVYQIHSVPRSYEPTVEKGIEFYHPEDRPQIREAFEQLCATGEPYDLELRIVTGDDEVRWVRTWGEALTEDGEVVGARGVIRDIHERKQREHALQTERDIMEQVFETSPVGIVVHDATGSVVRANEQAASLLDIDHTALEGADYRPAEVSVRSTDDEELPDRQLPVGRIVATGEPVRDEELVVETPEGDRIVVTVDGVPVFENGELRRVVVAVDDVTERVERERQLETRRDRLAVLDRINGIIREVHTALLGKTTRTEVEQAVCDRLADSGRYQYTAALRPTGDGNFEVRADCDDQPPALGGVLDDQSGPDSVCPARRAVEIKSPQVVEDVGDTGQFHLGPWQDLLAERSVGSMAVIPVAYDDNQYGVVVVCATEADAFSRRELEVLGELGGNVGHAIAAVESQQRETTLAALYEATQDLLAAKRKDEVCEAAFDTAESVLDPPGVGIFLFDDEKNVLQPTKLNDDLQTFYGETTPGPDNADSAVWQAYATGEEQCLSDVQASGGLGAAVESGLALPLGEHGVLVVTAAERGAFEDQRRRLVNLLGDTTEATLDRVDRQDRIRERGEKLRQRKKRLAQFEQMLSFVGEVDQLCREAGTREEVERGLCERLVAVENHTFAWVGAVPPGEEHVEPRAWAGVEDGYLDSLSLPLDSTEPAVRAVTDGSVVVDNTTDHLREGAWAREAVECNYESVVAVPLAHGETTYGVLAVYADQPDAFDDIVRPVVEKVGESAAHSINTIETERGILAEQTVELELALPESDSFLNAVAGVAGEQVQYHEVVPERDGRASVLFGLSEPPTADVLALEDEFVAVDSLTRVERDTGHLFRATLSSQTVPTTLLECGAIPRDVTASTAETVATVRLPQETNVRVFLDRVRESYAGTELVARRPAEQHGTTRGTVQTTLTEELTDRQREVLLTAYESGFFESPRQTTGAELADLLGVSQPTVTHHLREAQRRLFTTLFTE